MKKFIVFSLIAIMAFAFVALSPSQAEDNQEANSDAAVMTTAANKDQNQIQARQQLMSSLEKILSPDQIKYFTNIIKDGNSLYGVRRMEMKASSTEDVKASTTATTTNGQNLVRQLEKIAAPWLVNQYEQIKKIGTALWGLKKMNMEQNGNQEANRASSTPKFISTTESACVIAAIKVKDAALTLNNETAATAFNSAISNRTTCQETAINATATATSSGEAIANQHNELKLCLKSFQEAVKSVKDKAAADHKAVWTAYQTSLKACGAASSSETLMVEDGGGDIFEGAME